MKSYIEYCYVKSPSPRPLVVVPLGAVPPVDVPFWLIVVCTIPRAARSPPFAADVLAPRPPLTHSSAASRRDSPSPRPLVVVPLGAVPPVDVPLWLIVVCLLAASDGINLTASITFFTLSRGAIVHVLNASSTRGSSGDVAGPSADMLRSPRRVVVQWYQRRVSSGEVAIVCPSCFDCKNMDMKLKC